ncbi:MAG: NapC/NirT family cytochrome c, partial [Deltaproteobacteria bacterium]|nr:NapC/NirT family cytochrome c [Deltaproteobacteria bacterium]
MADRFISYTRNLMSLMGAVLVTASAVLFLAFFGLELLGFEGGPYLGIISFLVLPALFVFGLLLIPVGAWRARRRARRKQSGVPSLPVFDLNQPRIRRGVLAFAGLTALNLVILSLAAYKGVEVMDSVSFCGKACHTVMEPEYTAYQRSPHSRVRCTECHIGPGAPWFVKSKLSGAWQLVA